MKAKASLHQKKYEKSKSRQSNLQRIITLLVNSAKTRSDKRSGPSISDILTKTVFLRLIIACLILIATLIIDPINKIRTAFMLIAVLFCGCDIFSNAMKRKLNNSILSYSIIITISTIVAFILGYSTEAVVMVVLYRICIYLVLYTTEKTKRSAIGFIDPEDADIVYYAENVINDNEKLKLKLEDVLLKNSKLILRSIIVLSVIYAVALPLLAHYSFKASIYRSLSILIVSAPFSITAGMNAVASVGLGIAASKGSIFSNASILEEIKYSKLAIFNENLFQSNDQPSIIAVEATEIDEDTMLNLVSNLLYDSNQIFAKAILSARKYKYLPGLIKNYKETVDYVEGEINGSKIYFGKLDAVEQFLGERTINEHLDGDYYHLIISDKYIGAIVISRIYPIKTDDTIKCLRNRGVIKSILISESYSYLDENTNNNDEFDETYHVLTKEQIFDKIYEICSKGRYKKIYLFAEDKLNHSNADFDIKTGITPANEDITVIPEYFNNFPETIDISERMIEVAKENSLFVFIIKAVLIFLAMIGFSNIWFAVFIDLSAALATILNAIRVANKPLIKLDFLRKI